MREAAMAVVVAVAAGAVEAAAAYAKRIAGAEVAVIEARTRVEIVGLELQAARMEAEAAEARAAARAAARPAHRPHASRRHR